MEEDYGLKDIADLLLYVLRN